MQTVALTTGWTFDFYLREFDKSNRFARTLILCRLALSLDEEKLIFGTHFVWTGEDLERKEMACAPLSISWLPCQYNSYYIFRS
jgi:hypothetical protein